MMEKKQAEEKEKQEKRRKEEEEKEKKRKEKDKEKGKRKIYEMEEGFFLKKKMMTMLKGEQQKSQSRMKYLN